MQRSVVVSIVVILLLGSSLGAFGATTTVRADYSTVQATVDAAQLADEGFESGDLRAWAWSLQMPPVAWTLDQEEQHSGRYSVRAGRAMFNTIDPSKTDMTSRLWINLQVREGYVHFYTRVKKGNTLWFTVCEPLSQYVWYSGRGCIVKKISATNGWREVKVWVPSGYWHFQWENRSIWNRSIWIDDITFAETSKSLQADKKRADELFQEGTTAAVNNEHDTAVELLTAALDLYREIENPRGEARCLEVLGFTYSEHGCPYEAVKLYRQALALYQSFLDCPGMSKSLSEEGVARVQYALGSACIGLGAYDQAIERLNQSLAVWTTMLEGNPSSDMIADLLSNASLQNATCLRLLSTAYLWVGNREQALTYLTIALEIYKRRGSINGEVACLVGLADYWLSEGGNLRALDYAKQALGLAEPLNNRSLKAACLRMLGLCNEKLSQYAKAIDYYEQALEIARSVDDQDGILRAQWWLGRSLWKTGYLDQAKASYEEAIAILEKTRSGIEEEGFRESFFSKFRPLYEGYLNLLLEMGDEDHTVSVAERCRARTFLDLLAKGPVGTIENVAEEGIKTGVVNPDAISEDMQEVVNSLPADTATLEYFVTDDVTYVWAIKDGEVNGPFTITHSRQELMDKVIETRKWLEEQNTVVNRDLAELYGWLIRPVEDLLPQTNGGRNVPHLIIIPSGPLYYLPFQALIWTSDDLSENAPLIAHYAISYSPSLATLKYAQQREGDAYQQSTFLGLADPDSGNPDIPRLPEAQTEARTVAKLFPVAAVYVDKQATEDVVQSHSATAREILLSTHGLFNPHNPMFSYLVVSPTEENTDGKLHAYEVFGLPLHADMVVLSACETLLPAIEEMKEQVNKVAGRGPEDKQQPLTDDQLKELTAGDEVVGLTRAFISAGASSVLSSLWSVPSGSTSQLMVSFYKHMKEGMDKAQALRAAQLEVMNTSGCTQPWYWAAFNLMGNWR
jgi:CHAT domain-containing protein